MADDIDKKAFEEMIKITDPFDPLFAPSTGKSVGKLNEELEAKWMEENVKMGYPPDLGLPGGSVAKFVKTLERLPKKELGKVLKAIGERVRKYRKKDPVAMKKYVEDQAKVAEEIAGIKFETSIAQGQRQYLDYLVGEHKDIGKLVSRFKTPPKIPLVKK